MQVAYIDFEMGETPQFSAGLTTLGFIQSHFMSFVKKNKLFWLLDSILMSNVYTLLQIESDADILWKPDVREKNEEVAARGMKFLNW